MRELAAHVNRGGGRKRQPDLLIACIVVSEPSDVRYDEASFSGGYEDEISSRLLIQEITSATLSLLTFTGSSGGVLKFRIIPLSAHLLQLIMAWRLTMQVRFTLQNLLGSRCDFMFSNLSQKISELPSFCRNTSVRLLTRQI